jgi:hypothetical protein
LPVFESICRLALSGASCRLGAWLNHVISQERAQRSLGGCSLSAAGTSSIQLFRSFNGMLESAGPNQNVLRCERVVQDAQSRRCQSRLRALMLRSVPHIGSSKASSLTRKTRFLHDGPSECPARETCSRCFLIFALHPLRVSNRVVTRCSIWDLSIQTHCPKPPLGGTRLISEAQPWYRESRRVLAR